MLSKIIAKPFGENKIKKIASIEVKSLSDLHSNKFGVTSEDGNKCTVCGEIYNCPGHFGFIDLKIYIFHPLFKDTAINIMNRYCFKCEYIVISSPCPNCKSHLKKMNKISKGYIMYSKNLKEKEFEITAEYVNIIMNKVAKKAIENNDKTVYEFAMRAKSCVIRFLLIPPRYMRAYDMDVEALEKTNNTYERLLQYVFSSKQEHKKIYDLVSKIMGIYDNKKTRKITSQKGIMDTMSGKKSIFRRYCLGKRVENSGRAVITGDSNIPMDSIVIPRKMAASITIKDTVNNNNLKYYRKMARKKHLKIFEKYIDESDIYQGFVIKRNLIDGDLIIFNRQPTLTKVSIMGFKVIIAKDDRKVISFNQQITTPFNADFDGDEMNIYGFCSNFSIKFIKERMLAINNIISPLGPFPIIKSSKDTIMGVYLLTKYKYLINRKYVNDMILATGNDNKIIRRWNSINMDLPFDGRLLVSLAFHKNFNYYERDVIIKNGILMNGVINDDILSKGKKSIIFTIHESFGSCETIRFLEKLQLVVSKWLSTSGFSVGYDDCRLLKEGEKRLTLMLNEFTIESKNIMKTYDEYESETKIKKLSRTLMEQAEKIQSIFLMNTNLKDIINSGARGSLENITSITSFVGQQEINEKISKRFDISDTGFCKSSYSKGLTRKEFLLHQTSAREGLIRTYIGTGESGYLSRRARMCIGNIKILENRTVGDNEKTIRFIYGHDGTKSEHPSSLIENNILLNIQNVV